ncbi:hypothetical protein SC206_18230 [Rouxiella sp. T17]|uniref:hypothetical protein n=1 Tax=Rouxiella sp. T17 TaxID=3085684 RepID=UPI002FCC52F6
MDRDLNILNLHFNIIQLTLGETLIGYLVKTENSETPQSIILPNGNDLGDYACANRAIIAAISNYTGLEESKIVLYPSDIKSTFHNLALMAYMSENRTLH